VQRGQQRVAIGQGGWRKARERIPVQYGVKFLVPKPGQQHFANGRGVYRQAAANA
jgi:hypothetical protein